MEFKTYLKRGLYAGLLAPFIIGILGMLSSFLEERKLDLDYNLSFFVVLILPSLLLVCVPSGVLIGWIWAELRNKDLRRNLMNIKPGVKRAFYRGLMTPLVIVILLALLIFLRPDGF